MCGIAGEVRVDGRLPDVGAVARMADVMAPRGPDGAGVWSAGCVALGHRRLAIIDLSGRGHQPMVDSELGLAVVYNGCIYNHRELRRELEGAGYRLIHDARTEPWGQITARLLSPEGLLTAVCYSPSFQSDSDVNT